MTPINVMFVTNGNIAYISEHLMLCLGGTVLVEHPHNEVFDNQNKPIVIYSKKHRVYKKTPNAMV